MPPNKAATALCLLALTATAQAEPMTPTNPTDAPSQTQTPPAETREVAEPVPADKHERPPRHGYGIGYEYRMRHRLEWNKPDHLERPERPEHPLHLDRPERHERPEHPGRGHR